MSLTKYTENTNVISELANEPTLTAEEIKAKFDEADNSVKTYLNNTLTTEIEQLVATEKSSLLTALANLRTELQSYVSSQILADNQSKYPVGKIIMSTVNTNPATYLGFGTWQAWGAGRVPVGVNENDTDFNESDKTGGEKTHTLTESELAPHKHNMSPPDSSQNIGEKWEATGRWIDTTTAGLVSWTESAGGGQPHNNLQPYITCYMWKRVS